MSLNFVWHREYRAGLARICFSRLAIDFALVCWPVSVAFSRLGNCIRLLITVCLKSKKIEMNLNLRSTLFSIFPSKFSAQIRTPGAHWRPRKGPLLDQSSLPFYKSFADRAHTLLGRFSNQWPVSRPMSRSVS